jgi:UDP-arabinose 4-epimerase
MSTVLVTGGAGYIGSHACKALAAAGYEPVVYDNLVYGHREAVRWGPLEIGDTADEARLVEVIERHRPVAAMHFAAYAYVGESVADPGKYYRNNVGGTVGLLEALRRCEVPHLVFSSTCATYGVPVTEHIAEDHPQAPINPYGRSKLMVEAILRDYDAACGLRSLSLRYFNAAGADPDGEIGEHHDPETHLIPLILDAALGRRPHITVFGSDYDTPDGTCIRDYIHVTDLAAAHVQALAALQRGEPTGAINLGNGAGYSVREVVEAAGRITGRQIPCVLGERRPGDPARLVAAAGRARSALGWEPAYPDLDAIIGTAWSWHRRLHGDA